MSQNNRIKILIVTKEHQHARLLRKYLEEDQYQVFESHQGKYALLTLIQTMPKVIFLDWDLPDICALTVTRLIRSDYRFARVPIIMTGIQIENENKILALEAGVDLCMDGFIFQNELGARLHALLRRANQENH